MRHLLTICAILLLTTLVYSRISESYFCGYDDFIEVHRAEFEDKAEPVKILTTTHYKSFKYRPLSRALNLATYLGGSNEATLFRIRNLFFHCVATIAVYWLGWLLFGSFPVAVASALLFAIHPLANQPVIAAVFTNTTANAVLLGALALFILSWKRKSPALLIFSLLCGAVSVYTYESGIVLAGLMAAWLALEYLFTRRRPPVWFLVVFLVLGGALFGSYLLARRLFASEGKTSITAPVTVVKNSVLYYGVILLPVDPVLSNQWLGTPLPSEIRQSGRIGWPWIAAGAIAVSLAALVLFVRRKRIVHWALGLAWSRILFLLLGMVLTLLPFLVFSDHVSETYAYLPVAFYCLLLSYLLSTIPSRFAFAAAVGVLAFLFCSATWIRNQRVVRCAVTAKTILSNLPAAEWKQGPWLVRLGKAPGETTAARYGFYNYYGLDTLGTGDYGLRAVDFALQIAFGNAQLTTEVLPPDEMKSRCGSLGSRESCFWVYSDGRVAEFGKPLSRNRLSGALADLLSAREELLHRGRLGL